MNSGIVIWYNWCDWCRKPIGHQLGFQGCSPTVKRSQNNRVHDFSVFLADHKNNHPTSSVSSPLRRLWSEGKWKKTMKNIGVFAKKKWNYQLPSSISFNQPDITSPPVQGTNATELVLGVHVLQQILATHFMATGFCIPWPPLLWSYCWVKTMGFSWGFTDLLLGKNHMKIQAIQIHHRFVC